MLSKKEQQLLDLLEPYAQTHKVEIITVEIIGAKKAPIIRVYIDAEGGVSFQELSSAQAWIGDMLDEIDPFPGAYTLEVSSPGIDRPLRTLSHFERAIGEEVRVKTLEPLSGRSNFKGTLCALEGTTLLISTEHAEDDVDSSTSTNESFRIPIESIKKANVIGKVEF